MSPKPETQGLAFSIQILNACWASSAENSRLTRPKVTEKSLNISFQQRLFGTLCRSNSDGDAIVSIGASSALCSTNWASTSHAGSTCSQLVNGVRCVRLACALTVCRLQLLTGTAGLSKDEGHG